MNIEESKHSGPLKRALAASVLALVVALAGGVSGQPAKEPPKDLRLQGEGPWIVRVPTVDPEQVRALAEWADVWAVYPTKGYTVIQVERADAERLVAEGHELRLDERRTSRLRLAGKMLKNQTSGIPGFPCYRTVEETFATAEAIVSAHSGLATWTDVGDSWEKTENPSNGYDLKVLVLTQSEVAGDKPVFFANCAIHAREYTTAELCTRFAELLVDGYGVDPDVTWLLDHHEVHLLLHTNPDGRKKAETGLSWRKNTNNDYCSNTNNRGADLNRNFEFQWGCCGGSSGSQCNTTYRGPSPASEPEVQAVESYTTSIFPDQRSAGLTSPAPDDATGVAIDIHSSGQLVLWPWGFTSTVAPNGTQLQTLGRKLAYFNGHFPEQAIGLYPTDGTTDDFWYGELGVAGFTFELGTAFFESCAYFETNILPGNLPSLFYAAKVARTPYLTPAGPDALAAAVPPRAVEAGDLVTVTALADDTRFSTVNGTESSQTIAAAEVYVDVPPWDSGTPISMAASDGTFNSTREGVEATLDTDGFAEGRHTLFVRAMDDDDDWGAVSAVFLHVIDPETAPVIEGTVLDALTSAPLAAVVTAGDFAAETDAGGFYSMQVPAGTYDVTVLAAGYQSSTTEDVAAAAEETEVADFDLHPFVGLWDDDAEAGSPGWTATSPWAISDDAAFSPTHAWTDSPGTLYANNRDVSLTSPVFDLTDYTDATLSFRHGYDLEQGFDFAYVEYSLNGGSNWTGVAVYTGTDETTPWLYEEIDLSVLDGVSQARFRFRIDTDDSVQEDGWFVDDVLLTAVFDGNNPPLVAITAPADGASFEESEPIAFAAIASDLEDGNLASSLAWTSSLDGSIGSGASFATSSLSQGVHRITAEVTDSGSASGSDAVTVRVGVTPVMWTSFKADASVPGVGTAADEDVVGYDEVAETWSLLFDGSDVGLSSLEISGLAVLPDGDLLLSFTTAATIGGLSVDDSDVVRFTPTSLGAATAGSFSMYFDGSDVSLSATDEGVDAVALAADGRLIVSVTGNFSAGGASGADEDLFVFTGTLGTSTSGTFAIFFDGSDVGLTSSSEDLDGASVTASGDLAFSTTGAFSVTGLSGDNEDVPEFSGSFGSSTSGTFSMRHDLSALGIAGSADVGALHLAE